jgi:RND family efflux transporter MFP subunit|tara:strand:- start:188 stop:1468 length:1281 start_codon:yes stop_codon:yes gene_type:complete
MTRRVLQILLPLMIVGIGISGSILLVTNKRQVQPIPRERLTPRIETVEVTLGNFQPTITAQGTVKAHTVIGLSPEISGRIIFVSPKLVVGGLFDEAEELVRIDARDYELVLKQAHADINIAQAQITNAMAQLSSAAAKRAQSEARKMREEAEANAARAEWILLGKKMEPPDLLLRIPQIKEARAGITSAIALSSAANAQMQSAAALVKAAEATREQAELNVKRCVIKAPFRCRVQSRNVGVGMIASRASVLAQLQSIDYAEIPLPLPLDEFRHLQITNACRGGTILTNGPPVTLAANGNQWSGRIIRSEGEIQADTQMMAVVARVSKPYEEDRPTLNFGQFVSASIQGRKFKGVATLPATVLHDGDLVYVLNKNKLHSRKVKVFWSSRKNIAISSGLTNGERICATSLDSFVEGMGVTAIPKGKDE